VAAGHSILRDVDLVLAAGSHVAVVGASGAGKSSLLGLLLGWHRAAAGEVLVDGADLDLERLDRLRRETAWVDPGVQLWNRSLLANLRYGVAGAPPRDLSSVLDAALLRDLLQALPDGWQTPLGEGGGLVSGGEGQRVRLARAMLRPEARLVILDEPFRGLDRTSRHRLLRRARDWWRAATLLCVTHDISDTLDFDRVVVVSDGRVVERGKPHLLATQPGSRFAELLAQERDARRLFADATDWRKLHLAAGRLVEGEPP
jgi:ATP-binding cassette subfamily B protein